MKLHGQQNKRILDILYLNLKFEYTKYKII